METHQTTPGIDSDAVRISNASGAPPAPKWMRQRGATVRRGVSVGAVGDPLIQSDLEMSVLRFDESVGCEVSPSLRSQIDCGQSISVAEPADKYGVRSSNCRADGSAEVESRRSGAVAGNAPSSVRGDAGRSAIQNETNVRDAHLLLRSSQYGLGLDSSINDDHAARGCVSTVICAVSAIVRDRIRGLSRLITNRSRTTAVTVSVLVHSAVLLVLAISVVNTQGTSMQVKPVVAEFGTVVGESVIDLDMEPSLPNEGGHESSPLLLSDAIESLSAEAIEVAHADSVLGAIDAAGGDGTGRGFGEGAGNGLGTGLPLPAINIPSFAVTKGSFSVWADPRDPAPGQPYSIIIQVRLPQGVSKYRGSDLTGSVIGTDSYRQAIRFKSSDEFPVKDGAVEVPITVPGARQLVRDTIRVESRLLREKQVIQIEF